MKFSTATQFLNDKLRLYSSHSNVRGIPFIGDGFKQAHRKAVYGMIKRGESSEKDTVERIAASIASITDFHHGVSSMESTIVGLAQNFAGSNNIPLFEAYGQFGNRLNKKSSASRYIKTKLASACRMLIKKDDDIILEQIMSNGMAVEPKFFCPILPLVLINGAEGMGTGHSTYILAYNPQDIKEAVLTILNGKSLNKFDLKPWWNGFKGTVSREPNGQVVIEGVYSKSIKRGQTIITVTELPIGIQSDAYENHLQKLEDRGTITDYDNLSDENGFEFVITINKTSSLVNATDAEIKKALKLVSRETENLTVWNSEGNLFRFDCAEDLLADWVQWREGQFENRRLALIEKTEVDIKSANEKIRFIRFYLANVEFFRDNGKSAIMDALKAERFKEPEKMLSMPIYNLTRDQIAKLEQELAELEKQCEVLQNDTSMAMFKRELKAFKL